MKALQMSGIFLFVFIIQVSSQNRYVIIPAENYVPFFDLYDGFTINVPLNTPWYVFSDRDQNPVYKGAEHTDADQTVSLGTPFLVTGKSDSRLNLIEADKVTLDFSAGTWAYKAGFSENNVLRGWIDKDKLLLSNKCLKVRNPGTSWASPGAYHLKGLFIYSVLWKNDHYKYFTHIPDNYLPATEKTPALESEPFGYIFKIMSIKGTDWYLIGKRPEIKPFNREIGLFGWKPKEQVLLWKNQLALEYDWEHAESRKSQGVRITIAKNPHSEEISASEYTELQFVDKEYRHIYGSANAKYYTHRELGTNFRNVILNEGKNSIQVGVLKNSCNVNENIVLSGRAIANEIMVQMIRPKVIFVVDGTEGLKYQREDIISTIRSTGSKLIFMNSGMDIEFEFCAAIFRDKDAGNYIFEKMEHLAGLDAVASWLNDHLQVTGRKLSSGKQEAALFYGLNKTFEHIGSFQTVNYFNPTFYILLGKYGNQMHNDETTDAQRSVIEKLKCNQGDLMVVQMPLVSDKQSKNIDLNENSYNLFQAQFRDILSVYGKPTVKSIPGGTIEEFPNHPGSLMVYPEKNSSFSEEDLSSLISQTLLKNYNTVQNKMIKLVSNLKNTDLPCPGTKKELEDLTAMCSREFNYSQNTDPELVMEWAVRFIENAMPFIKTRPDGSVGISLNCYNFSNPGYVSMKYNFLDYQPFKYVLLLADTDVVRISDFASRISRLKGIEARVQLQKTWQYLLITSLGVCQNMYEANNLTISEATSLLTGFKGNSKYGNVRIGELLMTSVFPDGQVKEYIFEWGITHGYLQSVLKGKWVLDPAFLESVKPVIDGLLKSKGKPNITSAQLLNLSERLVKNDSRPVSDYFKGYPCMETDVLYKSKIYWIETDFFSHEGNDFVELLLSVVK